MAKNIKSTKNIGFIGGVNCYFLMPLFFLFFLNSCIPTAVNENATCDTGKTFNSVTRSCVTTSLISIPTTSSISFYEDVTTDLPLSYRDHDFDNAISCDATTDRLAEIVIGSCTCLAGSCSVQVNSVANWNGQSQFSYRITDNDGTSPYQLVALTVFPVNDNPSVIGTTFRDATEDIDKVLNFTNLVTDPDIITDGDILTYSISDVSSSSMGSFLVPTPNTTGLFTFDPTSDFSGIITFKLTVTDLSNASSSAVDMTIDFDPTDDSPTGTLSQVDMSEDSTIDVKLTYYDNDASFDASADSTADACVVDVSNDYGKDLFASSSCSCDITGDCSFTLTSSNHAWTGTNQSGSTSSKSYYFTYRVHVGNLWSADKTVDVNIDETSDGPIAFSMDVTADESNTVDATAISFSIIDATDGDKYESNFQRYQISKGPSYGTLTCYNKNGDATFDTTSDVSDATFDGTKNCSYLPRTGNLEGLGLEASVDLRNVNFKSTFKGEAGNAVRIYIIPDTTVDKEFIEVFGQSMDPTVDIKIHVSPNDSTPGVIQTLVSNHEVASLIVVASADNTTDPMAVSASDATNSYLLGGVNAADSFSYYVLDDESNISNIATVNFSIDATNDSTTLCHYSLYEYAPECGLNDCIDNSSPFNRITPSSHTSSKPIIYYDHLSSVCWKSNGTSITNWEVVSSYIEDQLVNEKDKVVINGIRLDEGGDGEASQVLRLGIDITSDNLILIPIENIKFYYGPNEVNPGATIDSSAYSADTSEFRIEIVPVSGQSGTSEINFKVFDDNDASLDIKFKVTVNATSAQHNGWVSLSALGPKVNKYGQVKSDESRVCPYSRTKCDTGQECKGSGAPTKKPDLKYSIYFDEDKVSDPLEGCYYSTGDTSADWVLFKDKDSLFSCPISESELASECGSSVVGSCIFEEDSSADFFTNSVFKADATSDYNNVYYNLKTKKCYRNITNDVPSQNTDLEEINAGASVILSWNAFSISGTDATLVGHNVYRRLAKSGYDFDYDAPINKTLISSTTTSYTDNGKNSIRPPIPGTVYFYEVRPVISVGGTNIPTDTSEVYKTLRVIAPPNNMVFVHQSMANKGICSLMNSASDPRYQNYCSYQGPGEKIEESGARTSFVFDVKHHMLVDRFEAGCHFTNPPVCRGTSDGSCIRIKDTSADSLDSSVDASSDTIFYDRGMGNCIIKKDDNVYGDWKIMDASADMTTLDEKEFDHKLAELPPLVNVTQEFAHDFCKLRGTHQITKIIGVTNSNLSNLSGRLPSRSEQISYSLWPSTKTTSEIQTIEEGLSLNSTSKCNTAQADGLSNKYSDSDHPDSNSLFTIPGSSTSGIRSLMTGSGSTNGTSSCSSQFGVQDAVGNVKEWVYDRLKCPSLSTCEGVVAGDSTWDSLLPPVVGVNDGTGDNFNTSDSYSSFKKYKLDGKIGPCRDSDSDGFCDSYMGEWEFDDQLFSAGRFIVPMGLPAHTDFPNNYSSDISPYLMEIGPTSGITNARLANDKFILNSHHIYAEKDGCGSLAGGGGYLDNGGAGVFHVEVIPCTDTSYQYITVGQMSIKALHKDPQLKLTIKDATTGSYEFTLTTGDNSADILIDVSSDNLPNYTTIVNALNSNSAFNSSADATVSEGVGTDSMATQSQTSFTIINSSPKRPDVGFRCIVPITESTFEESVP